MKKSGTSGTPSIQSLGRGLSILEAVAESDGPVALKELTVLLGIDRSSVFRLANTLKRRRFLSLAEGRKQYVLGPSIWRLSRKQGQGLLTALCRDHLRALSLGPGKPRTSRSGTASTRSSSTTARRPARCCRCWGKPGRRYRCHCSAHGKALIADLRAADLAALFGQAKLTRHTRRTITSHTRLARACARIRADGFATDDGEDVEELRCVAAPIRDRDARIVASIGISAPVTRFPVSRYPIAAREVTEAARRISETLQR